MGRKGARGERERRKEREMTDDHFVATRAMFLGEIVGSKTAVSSADMIPLSLSRDSLSLRISVSSTPCKHTCKA